MLTEWSVPAILISSPASFNSFICGRIPLLAAVPRRLGSITTNVESPVMSSICLAKQIDDITGLSTLVVIDPKRRGTAANKGMRPQMKLLNDAGEEIKIAGTDHSVNITFQVGSLITVKDGRL